MWQVARIRSPWIKNRQIRWFIRRYQVDMRQALEPDPTSYADFNSFFTRALHSTARPVAPAAEDVVSPADGHVSQFGAIDRQRLVQAKGHEYSLAELLQADTVDAAPFMGGQFVTVYLSPRDYHRIHMPMTGRLREMRYVPGRLFSVNASTTRVIPRLFARNERVVMLFDTEIGPMALIMVGAIFVGGIETVWARTITPPRRRTTRAWRYDDEQGSELTFQRGQEIGRFNMGSTVILLLPPNGIAWDDSLYPGAPINMGVSVGRIRLPFAIKT